MRTAAIAKKQRLDIGLVLNTIDKPKLPIVVTVIRIAPYQLDSHDNLPTSAKHIVDQIAEWLCVDDRDKRILWLYEQEKGSYGIKIIIKKLSTKPYVEILERKLQHAVKAARYWKNLAGGSRRERSRFL